MPIVQSPRAPKTLTAREQELLSLAFRIRGILVKHASEHRVPGDDREVVGLPV